MRTSHTMMRVLARMRTGARRRRTGLNMTSGILKRSTPIATTDPSGSSKDCGGMFGFSSSWNGVSLTRHDDSLMSARRWPDAHAVWLAVAAADVAPAAAVRYVYHGLMKVPLAARE